MAIIESFTVVAGTSGNYGASFAGFRSVVEPNPCGTANGSTSSYGVSSTWYSNVTLSRLDYESYYGFSGIWLELQSSSAPSNSGWQDIRIGSNVYNRVDASYSTGSFHAQWGWNGQSNPFSSGSSYSIVVTDNGSTQAPVVTIPFGVSSGSVDMNNLRNFFGEPSWGSSMISASDLFKGGNLVPNVSGNSSVPTSGAIDLADFYNSETYLEIEKHPTGKFDDIFSGGSGTSTLTWNVATSPTAQSDIDVGYKAIKSVCEYRWIIDVTSQSGLNLNRILYNGSTVTNPSDPYTTVWSGDPTLSIQVDYGVQTANIAGTARFEVRKVWNGTTYSLNSNTANWAVTVENALE